MVSATQNTIGMKVGLRVREWVPSHAWTIASFLIVLPLKPTIITTLLLWWLLLFLYNRRGEHIRLSWPDFAVDKANSMVKVVTVILLSFGKCILNSGMQCSGFFIVFFTPTHRKIWMCFSITKLNWSNSSFEMLYQILSSIFDAVRLVGWVWSKFVKEKMNR